MSKQELEKKLKDIKDNIALIEVRLEDDEYPVEPEERESLIREKNELERQQKELEEQISNMQENEENTNEEPIAEFEASGRIDFRNNYLNALQQANIDPSNVYDPHGITGEENKNEDAEYELSYGEGGAYGSDDGAYNKYTITKRKKIEKIISEPEDRLKNIKDRIASIEVQIEDDEYPVGPEEREFLIREKNELERQQKELEEQIGNIQENEGNSNGDRSNEGNSNDDRSNEGNSNGDRSNEGNSNDDRSNEGNSNDDRSNEGNSNGDRSNEGNSNGDRSNEGTSNGGKSNKEPIKGFDTSGRTTRMPVTSGLQIFRKVLNDEGMPEIGKRHTLTSNPIVSVLPASILGTVGGVAAVSLIAPWLAPLGMLAVAAGTIGTFAATNGLTNFAFKGGIDLIVGKRKVTKQVEDVIKKLPDSELQLMVSYLTEEKIIDLKVNEVFLNALGNVLKQRADSFKNNKTPEYIDKMQEMDGLEQDYKILKQKLQSGTLSAADKAKVEHDLDACSTMIMQKRKEIEVIKENAQNLYRSFKETREATKSKGYFRKDNIKGGFLAKKNPSSREYLPAINEYADAELPLLEAKAINDDPNASQHDKRVAAERILVGSKAMDAVEGKYTVMKKVGPLAKSVGLFNFDSGIARLVSDREDRTVQKFANIARIAVFVGCQHKEIGEWIDEKAREQAQSDNLSQELDNTVKLANQNANEYNTLRNSVNTHNAKIDNLNKVDFTKVGEHSATVQADQMEMIALRGKFSGKYSKPQYAVEDSSIQQTFSSKLNQAGGITKVEEALESLRWDPNVVSKSANMNGYYKTTGPADHSNTYGSIDQMAAVDQYNKFIDGLKDVLSGGKIPVGGPQGPITRTAGQPTHNNVSFWANLFLPIFNAIAEVKDRKGLSEKNNSKKNERGGR